MEKHRQAADIEAGLAAGAGLDKAADANEEVFHGTVDAGGADEEIGVGAIQGIAENADGGGLDVSAQTGRDASPAALGGRGSSAAADVSGALDGPVASPDPLAGRGASPGALAGRGARPAADVAGALAGRGASPGAEGVRIQRVRIVVRQEVDPPLRWAFLRRVYITLALQFAVTSAIAAIACKVLSVPRFFHTASEAAMIVSVAGPISIILAMLPLRAYKDEYPFNMLFLGVFTLCKAFNATMVSANVNGKILLLTAFLVAILFMSFTLYTYWAAHKGSGFTVMFPFLFTSIIVVMVYVIIQIFYPLGSVRATIGGCIATVAYSAFIVQSTNMIVDRYTCDEFMPAAIQLSMDVNI